MTEASQFDAWSAGDSYERYMGRWSRPVARRFVDWLEPPGQARWLDVGCGTGALTETILTASDPMSILSLDPSEGFIRHARSAISDPRVTLDVGNAMDLPLPDAAVDVVVSGLVLNFVPDPVAALTQMRRVTVPGGLVGFYVWDYPGGGMGFISAFWQVATTLDPAAAALTEGSRFPGCTRDGLLATCQSAGLTDARIEPIATQSVFADFDDFWHPFTLGAGPAPGYCKSLSPAHRDALRDGLAERLGRSGPISLPARAWAMKAEV